MVATMVVNLLVSDATSAAAGHGCQSEVLLADATHTRSDVFTSLTVIARPGRHAGLVIPLLDPLAAHRRRRIHRPRRVGDLQGRHATCSPIGSSIAEDDVRAVVMSVPAVMGCHEIRTRGPADYVFLDLHVWMASKTPLDQAHAVSHEVKDRLMARFPQIRDAVIHIEPPPREDDPGRGERK